MVRPGFRMFFAHPPGEQNTDTFRQFQELQIVLREMEKEIATLRLELETMREALTV